MIKIKILLFEQELEEYFLKNQISITNDITDDYNVIVINAQNITYLPENVEENNLYVQLTGKPSDIVVKRKYENAHFFRHPDEIIDEMFSYIEEDTPEPIVGNSFLGVSYSNKGGVGKTTSAISLAFCLSEMGYKTVIADFDFKGPNLATYFNIKRPYDYIKDGISNESLNKAIRKADNNLYVLPINSDIYIPSIKDSDLQEVCDYLQNRFQCVIIDTMIAPHENTYMWEVFKRANLVYAITNQAKITMEETGMYAPSLLLMGVEPHNIRIILNQYSPKQTSIKQVEKAFNQHLKIKSGLPKLVGVFPHNWDEQLKALAEGKYLNQEEWRKVCNEIPNYLKAEINENISEEEVKNGFLTKLKGRFSRA